MATDFTTIISGETADNKCSDQDIVELRNSLEALRKSEERFRSMVDISSDWIWEVDRNGKFTYASEKVKDVLGYEPEEIVGRSVFDFMTPDEAERMADIFEESADSAEPIVGLENFNLHKNGSIVIAETSGVPIFDEKGKLIGYRGIDRDITRRKRAEEKLKENAHFLQTLMDAIPNPIFYKDVSGNYLGCNKSFESYIGLKKDRIIGKSVYDISPKQLADRYNEMDMALFKEGGIQTYKSSVRYADGSIHDVIFNKATFTDTSKKIIGLIGIILDITEQKKMEESIRKLNDDLDAKVKERTRQLLEAQEALIRKEKLAVLGQLAGTIGHEIRNPLGIMNNAVYFLKTVMTDADDSVKEYLDIIKQEIDNSQRIINELLDYSRTKKPHVSPLAVKALVEQSLNKCGVPGKIKADVDIPDELPFINVDMFQMVQVLQNIIKNAVEAMPDGGTLKITACQVHGSRFMVQGLEEGKTQPETDSPASKAGLIEITVTDTGTGISPENMKTLFQPLFTTKVKGIGLGLVVCKNLVEANGGSVSVDSHLGKGTTFRILLPVSGGDK